MEVKLKMIVNEEQYESSIPANMTLLEYIRTYIGLTGTKEGCGTGDCGSCSIHVDGRVVKSCLMLAAEAIGKNVTTVEGLSQNGRVHPIQMAFAKYWGTQCGYCTPGFIMSVKELLERNHNPTEEEIKHAIAGNLCRCTGYVKIIESIKQSAKEMRSKGDIHVRTEVDSRHFNA